MGRGRRFDDAACSMWLVRVAEGGRMKASIAEAAAAWLRKFAQHCGRHNYRVSFEKALRRLQFVTARGELGKGAA